jgi:predicted nuclease of predicted toxin-antitoxin system
MKRSSLRSDAFSGRRDVSRHVVERLRAAGFDVAAIGSMNPGALDSDVLATARRDGRILITEDRDFGELVVRQRLEVQGVVLLELDRLSTVAEADRVVAVVSPNVDKLSGNLLVIEPGRARIRPLRR